MKLAIQTVANVFANRLGDNDRRVMSSPLPQTGGHADFEITGALLRVTLDQHLSTQFTITTADQNNLDRQGLANKYADPAVAAIKNQFMGRAKAYVVSQALPAIGSQAIAEHNGMNVRVTEEDVEGGTRYTLEVLLGTFSL